MRSTSGGWLELRGPKGTSFVLSFTSKRQGATSRSSCEAEVAAADYVIRKEVLPISYLIDTIIEARKGSHKAPKKDSQLPSYLRSPPPHAARSIPLFVWEDNEAALLVLKGLLSKELKHVSRTHAIHVAFLQEVLKETGASLAHVVTSEQKADIFTKEFVDVGKWQTLLDLLGLTTSSST